MKRLHVASICRKAASIFSLVVLLSFAAAPLTLAEPVDPNAQVCSNLVDTTSPPSVCQKNTTENPIVGPDGLMTKIAQTLVYLTGVISVIMVIVGGLKYMFSAGDSNGVQSAKNTILYALVGLIVAVSGQAIVSLVISRL